MRAVCDPWSRLKLQVYSGLDLRRRRDLTPSSKFRSPSGELRSIHLASAGDRVGGGVLENAQFLCRVRSLLQPPAGLAPCFVDACGSIRIKLSLYRPLPIEINCPVVLRMKLCVAPDCESCRACALCRSRCSGHSAYDTLDKNPPGRLSRFDQTGVAWPHDPHRPRCSTQRAPCLLCRTMSAVNCVNRSPVHLNHAELIFWP